MNSSGESSAATTSRFSLTAGPAVKRIMQEARELSNDPSTDYTAAPLEVRPTRLLEYELV